MIKLNVANRIIPKADAPANSHKSIISSQVSLSLCPETSLDSLCQHLDKSVIVESGTVMDMLFESGSWSHNNVLFFSHVGTGSISDADFISWVHLCLANTTYLNCILLVTYFWSSDSSWLAKHKKPNNRFSSSININEISLVRFWLNWVQFVIDDWRKPSNWKSQKSFFVTFSVINLYAWTNQIARNRLLTGFLHICFVHTSPCTDMTRPIWSANGGSLMNGRFRAGTQPQTEEDRNPNDLVRWWMLVTRRRGRSMGKPISQS